MLGIRQNRLLECGKTPHQLGETLTFLRFKGPLIVPSLPHPSTSAHCTGRCLDIFNMSTTSAPAIRHTLRSCALPLRSQKRWAQVHDVRFVATHQDTNKIIDRYKEKLAQKAKEYTFGTTQSEHTLSHQQRRTWLDIISQRSLQGKDPRLPTCCFENPL